MECPFNWDYPENDLPIELYIQILTEKLHSVQEEHQFQWSRSVVSLIVAYENSSKLHEHDRALTHIAWVEQHTRELRDSKCSEPLYLAVRSTLEHVTLATKAHILADSGKAEEAKKVAKQVVPLGEGDKDRASLLGLKAAMFSRYGLEGHKMELDCAREAAKLDPAEGEWHMRIGNALGKIRRVEKFEISKEEMAAFEKAYSSRKDGSFIVHLAHLYCEYSTFLYFNKDPRSGRFDYRKSEMYSREAIDLFKEALDLRPDCSSTMARVAHGLLKIRHKKLLDMTFIKSLLDRVVELAPHNCLVNHDMGLYYDKFESNTEQAIFYLEKANDQQNIAAFMYMISLKWKHRRQEVIHDLTRALENIYTVNSYEKAQVGAYLGAAYILLEDNWELGVEKLVRSLQEDNSGKYLLDFYSFYGKSVNFLGVIRSEVEKRASRRSSNQNNVFNTFLELCKEFNLNISERTCFEEYRQFQLEGRHARRSNSWRS